MYRYKFPYMDTLIGSKYFRRGERKDSRQYRLYRINKSGNIEYEEKIQEKEDKAWRLLTKYKYKPESFSWKKVR